ncbi:squalene synthase HpnC [Rugosimonospora africana]|uniref:Phytoene synthase n=1 Tax=Rugosimonospora africana TaxID=556532 RepID=A0A8J3VPZ2_9ACTN|nr:squalene synthase HpnC [Rugosimonospora africana]GIH14604.1 phytoene synthase [Rugosimonospora africana]
MAADARATEGATRSGGRADDYLRDREQAENFPVALRVLPGRLRVHLSAVYDVARVIDDLGDQADGDRTALLEEFRADLATIWRGDTPKAPVLRRLAPTVRACGLSQQTFDNLVQANLQDQVVSEYPTYRDLLGYCMLSAEPVGRIVLELFGVSTPERIELSDRICTALQLIEHWQDVAEDRRAGRVYLPLEDLDRFGVTPSDLDQSQTSDKVRALLAFEAERARHLLDAGTPLLGQLRGWARLAVTGYVAGGRAALDGLRRAQWDVLSGSPPVRRLDVVRHLTTLLLRRRVAS